VAVSLVVDGQTAREPRFGAAAGFAERVGRLIAAGDIVTDAVLNINVPDLPADQICGVAVTRAAGAGYVKLKAVPQEAGLVYAKGVRPVDATRCPEGTDIWAVNAGMISVTPLKPQVTDHESVAGLSETLLKLGFDLKQN